MDDNSLFVDNLDAGDCTYHFDVSLTAKGHRCLKISEQPHGAKAATRSICVHADHAHRFRELFDHAMGFLSTRKAEGSVRPELDGI